MLHVYVYSEHKYTNVYVFCADSSRYNETKKYFNKNAKHWH